MSCCTSARSILTSRTEDAPSSYVEHRTENREPPVVESARELDTVVRTTNRSLSLPAETKEDWESSFLLVSDSLSSTIISRERLLKALYISGRHPSKSHISVLWRKYAKEDGIDFHDFSRLCRDERIPTPEDIMDIFEVLDSEAPNKTERGVIKMDDLSNMLATKGEKMSQSEITSVKRLLEQWTDSYGYFSYESLCNHIMKTIKECKELARDHRVYRLENPLPKSSEGPRRDTYEDDRNERKPLLRSRSKDIEKSEEQASLQQQMKKRFPNSIYAKLFDPTHIPKPKMPNFQVSFYL